MYLTDCMANIFRSVEFSALAIRTLFYTTNKAPAQKAECKECVILDSALSWHGYELINDKRPELTIVCLYVTHNISLRFDLIVIT